MRRFALRALPALAACAVFAAEPVASRAPVYSQATIVNLGNGVPGELAPNSLAVIYGANLSNATISRLEASPSSLLMPTLLPGAGVSVKVNGILAGLEYASPEAVVFVVPPELVGGPAKVVLTRNSLNGPTVQVQLRDAAPSLLPLDSGWTLARRADTLEWCLPQQGARPGDEVILYGTGWGPLLRQPVNLQIPDRPNELKARAGVRVLLDGAEVEPGRILYAGAAPGVPGVYQLRFRLPAWSPPDPEIRVSISGLLTQPGLRLPVAAPATQPPAERMRFME
ncbi:MAG: hypothetical protein N2036_10075 [Bryobacteraceae bacterium]|nr:hypothetical protein [Bryobacteraceae bacterium]MCX7604408.1 hypothetical protein [Bryobacteraceae bacterium]